LAEKFEGNLLKYWMLLKVVENARRESGREKPMEVVRCSDRIRGPGKIFPQLAKELTRIKPRPDDQPLKRFEFLRRE